jgi:hypothetical protein
MFVRLQQQGFSRAGLLLSALGATLLALLAAGGPAVI